MTFDAVLTEAAHRYACDLLLQHVRGGRDQEELAFALWRPSTGEARTSALISRIVPPLDGERKLHGNASFEAAYLTRVVRLACAEQVGVAFMHNHLSAGWQEMSDVDVVAERDRIAPATRATGLPLIGLTLGTDGSWSARFWTWDGERFNRSWCDKVKVVGRAIHVTYNDRQMPPPRRQHMLRRTIDTWGESRQGDLARLRVGVVGVGSVGGLVAEMLSRIGVQRVTLIDPDRVEEHNLDRLTYASERDVGEKKVRLLAKHLRRGATADGFEVSERPSAIQVDECYRAALDCDVVFSAVDRPLPKDLLNHIAYTHCIPVISGGVFVDTKTDGTLGQAAWSVLAVGPERRCLRCDGQYTTSDVTMERDGSLDEPTYIPAERADGHPSNQNVLPFSANLASFMVLEMIRLVVAAPWWPRASGKLHYTYINGQLQATDCSCDTNCSIAARVGYGDRNPYPFLLRAAQGEIEGGRGSVRETLKRLLRTPRRLLERLR